VFNSSEFDSEGVNYLSIFWTKPLPANGPIDHYSINFTYLKNGQNVSVHDETTTMYYNWEFPCNNDGRYEVIIAVEAVNNQSSSGEPSQHFSTFVCTDPGISWLRLIF
jgi:hypothetical protein